MSGPYFRDCHLMLDEQAEQSFATTDLISERVRKIGGTTLRSVSHVSQLQRILGNNANYVTPSDMLAELAGDNKQLVGYMRATHTSCDEHNDVTTAITPDMDIAFEGEFGSGRVRAAVLAVASTRPRTSPVRLTMFREMPAPVEIPAGASHATSRRFTRFRRSRASRR
jgi:hypothetical protein